MLQPYTHQPVQASTSMLFKICLNQNLYRTHYTMKSHKFAHFAKLLCDIIFLLRSSECSSIYCTRSFRPGVLPCATSQAVNRQGFISQ